MTTILPTGTCFDDALELLVERLLEDPSFAHQRRLLLVHAIVLVMKGHDHEGKAYAHAWVEEKKGNRTICWHSGLVDGRRIYYAVRRNEYYRHARIQAVTYYTPRQAYDENRRTNNFGPWEERYGALCRSAGGPREIFAPRNHAAG